MKILLLLLVIFFLIMIYFSFFNHPQLETDFVNKLKKKVKPIIPPDHYERIKVFDMQEKFTTDVAYTKLKSKIWICTKDKNGKKEDENVLTYVLLHEYAHAINSLSIQHDKEFQKTFEELLKKADAAGIKYRKSDKICGKCLGPSCSLKK